MTDEEQRAIGRLEAIIFEMPYSASCVPPPLRVRLDATIVEAIDHAAEMLSNIKAAYFADARHREQQATDARSYTQLSVALRDLLGL